MKKGWPGCDPCRADFDIRSLPEAMAALRSVVVDDDHRKSETQPAALENREVLLSEELYPKARAMKPQDKTWATSL